jgi:hypothetical protein
MSARSVTTTGAAPGSCSIGFRRRGALGFGALGSAHCVGSAHDEGYVGGKRAAFGCARRRQTALPLILHGQHCRVLTLASAAIALLR